MTLEELNARISAIEECYDILMDTFLELGIEHPYVNEMLDTLRDRYRKLRDSAWNEFAEKIDELSKQA